MKNIDAIVSFIEERLHRILERPLMYGGSAAGVEILLYSYHELLAEASDRRKDFRLAYEEILEKHDCGSANFSTAYFWNQPNSTEAEAAAYVINRWEEILKRLEPSQS